jgi:saccharopine dehydrogenase (NAD+, L-lysine forming)
MAICVNARTDSIASCRKVTPTTTKALVSAGYTVNVEHSTTCVFSDDEFAAAGATVVPEGSWTQVPKDHIIIVVGLKELSTE